jgi:hypothetical protein
MKKQSNGWKDFVKRYGKYFIAFLIASILIYSIIYLCFIGDGFLSAGKDLAKEDWLSFLGAYLSFIGTVAVSLIALFQSSYYTKTENERRLYEHRKKIQPIFSVDIVEMNKQIDGTSEAFNLSNPSFPKHNNIKISIENVNSYPITHVIVFDKYICPLLKCNELKYLSCAYYDSEDAKRWAKKLIVLTDDFERNEQGVPKWFNICYEDIDGQAMFQTFELKDFDGTLYYSLEGIHEA